MQALSQSSAFLSTLSLRRATVIQKITVLTIAISIHALLAESDCRYFSDNRTVNISIHALLAESDDTSGATSRIFRAFLSTLSLRRATTLTITTCIVLKFLSTLSLRRATRVLECTRNAHADFYPRSPCGERLASLLAAGGSRYFYPRSPCGERQTCRAKL